jgi:wyosine [tRNA(Phe)-imidazoG37] synthetase (radical SAM superfamily)
MEYLQKRQGDMRARAMSFAQLSPMQQADYGFYRGGQQLGDAIGGALGGQDPQLKLISQRQRLLSQLDRSDPESYKKIALQAQQTGDSELATLISEAGRKLELDTSLIKQRNYEAKGAEPIQQIIRSGKYTPASVEAYNRSGKISDLRQVDSPDKVPAEIQKAYLVAKSKGLKEGTKEFNDEIVKQLEKTERERNIALEQRPKENLKQCTENLMLI